MLQFSARGTAQPRRTAIAALFMALGRCRARANARQWLALGQVPNVPRGNGLVADERTPPEEESPTTQAALFTPTTWRRHRWIRALLAAPVAALALAAAGPLADTPARADLSECLSGNLCIWQADYFAGSPIKQASSSIRNFATVPNLNDNVGSVRNNTSVAAYLFQNPDFRTDGGGLAFPELLEVPGIVLCQESQTGTPQGYQRNRSSMLFANEPTCSPSSLMTHSTVCRSGKVCVYTGSNFQGSLVYFSGSRADFREIAGLDNSTSSIQNLSSRAVYFFQNPRFGQDLDFGGTYVRPTCVPANSSKSSLGIMEDRISSAIVARTSSCAY